MNMFTRFRALLAAGCLAPMIGIAGSSMALALSAPTEISPGNLATGVSQSRQFSWFRVSGATSYRLQVSTDSTFAGTFYNQTLTDTTVQISGMAANTRYYWHVRALATGEEGPYGSRYTFVTMASSGGSSGSSGSSGSGSGSAPTSAPTLIAPSNNTTGSVLTPRFNWYRVTGVTSYRMQVSTDSTFATFFCNYGNIADSTLQLPSPGVATNTTYYWHVCAMNSAGNGPWSQRFTFTSGAGYGGSSGSGGSNGSGGSSGTAPASAPTLIALSNNTTGAVLTPRFYWRRVTGAATYRIQVSTDSTFTTTFFCNYTNIADSTMQLPSPGLAANTTYYWRVSAVNSAGNGPWAQKFTFTTGAGSSGSSGSGGSGGSSGSSGSGSSGGSSGSSGSGLTPPAAPNLLTPRDSATGIDIVLTLVWDWSVGSSNYTVQLSTSPTFASNISSFVTYSNSWNVTPLNAATTYYWRVKATSNTQGSSPWSSVRTFTTMTIPSRTGASVIAGHPRLMIDSALKVQLHGRTAAGSPFYADWLQLQTTATSFKAQPIRGYDYTHANFWVTGIQYDYEGTGWHMAAVSLALAYLASGDASYATKAIALADTMIYAEYDASQAKGPFQVDHSYPSRHLAPAMAMIYDWCYDRLDSSHKARMIACMNRWFDSLSFGFDTYQSHGAPTGNYFGSHLYGAAFMGYATYGDNPRAQAMIDWARDRFDGSVSTNLTTADRTPFSRTDAFEGSVKSKRGLLWQAPTTGITGTPFKGGTPVQGWSYSGDEWCRMIDYMIAVKVATGEDLAATHEGWLHDIFTSLRHALYPNNINLDPLGDWGGNQGASIFHELPVRLAYMLANTYDSAAAQHFAYVQTPQNSTYGYYGPSIWITPYESWELFLFKDVNRTATRPTIPPYYTAFAPAYPAGGSGNGAFPKFYMRSDWGSNATWATIDMQAANFDDHQHYRAGQLSIARGSDNLLIDVAGWRGTAPSLGITGNASGYGLLESSTKNTLFIDDFGDYSGNQPDYCGGQGPWGRNDMIAAELKDAFSYVRGDLTTAYDNVAHNPWSDTLTKRPVVFFYRSIAYLRSANIFVVYDQVKARNSANALGEYRKEIRWHTPVQPIISGKSVTLRHNVSKAYLHTLLPNHLSLKRVDESTNPDNQWGTGWDHIFNQHTWRVEVKDSTNPLSEPFLTAIQVGDSGMAEMTSSLVQTNDSLMVGTRIVSGGQTSYLLFNNRPGQVPAPIISTSYAIAGAGASTHMLCGMTPNGTYTHSTSNDTIFISAASNGLDTASAGGVLLFSITVGGSKTVAGNGRAVEAVTGERLLAVENYPNPVSGEETFHLHLAAPCARVTMTIYDPAGKLVATVADGPRAAGEHDLRYDVAGGALSNGIYYCRVDADGTIVTRQFVVAR